MAASSSSAPATDLLQVDLPAAPAVQLEMPTEPLYLSSWARVGVATNGVAFDDLVFRVEPPKAGLCRTRRTRRSPSGQRGTRERRSPGAFQLVAHDRNTGDELARRSIRGHRRVAGVDGPPASFIGKVLADSPDPAWGGGDPFVPQNLSVTPVLGNRNVAVVIAETSDSTALSAADQATLRTAWQNEVFDGVIRDGVLESARRYWRDVSDDQMDLVNAGIVGPIRLANNWASYGTADTTGQTDDWEAFARAAIADIRTQNEARGGGRPAAGGRPHDRRLDRARDPVAARARHEPGPVRVAERDAARAVTSSASRSPARHSASRSLGVDRHHHADHAHDPDVLDARRLGGARDEQAGSAARPSPTSWATTSAFPTSTPAPRTRSGPRTATSRRRPPGAGRRGRSCRGKRSSRSRCVVEKMMLGWVKPAHVRSLSFATLGPVDEEITLHASDLGAPPAGRESAVEIRIADKSNYYFEYRREQPTTFKDQDLPADRTVVGIHCVSGEEPSDRRNILRIRERQRQ